MVTETTDIDDINENENIEIFLETVSRILPNLLVLMTESSKWDDDAYYDLISECYSNTVFYSSLLNTNDNIKVELSLSNRNESSFTKMIESLLSDYNSLSIVANSDSSYDFPIDSDKMSNFISLCSENLSVVLSVLKEREKEYVDTTIDNSNGDDNFLATDIASNSESEAIKPRLDYCLEDFYGIGLHHCRFTDSMMNCNADCSNCAIALVNESASNVKWVDSKGNPVDSPYNAYVKDETGKLVPIVTLRTRCSKCGNTLRGYRVEPTKEEKQLQGISGKIRCAYCKNDHYEYGGLDE